MLKIKLAGLNVLIDNKYTYLEKQCKDYLSDFEKADMHISVTSEDIKKEYDICRKNFSKGYYESVCAYRKICKILPVFDRLMLHSAVAELSGRAVAFSGKSGIGKSTHALNLCRNFEDIRILNIDKPIIHINNETVSVYGTPWQGKENIGANISAILTDICFLEQSAYNKIVCLSKTDALPLLLVQLITPFEPSVAIKHLELVDRLLNNISFHKMYCTAELSAAMLSYKTLFKKENL